MIYASYDRPPAFLEGFAAALQMVAADCARDAQCETRIAATVDPRQSW